MDRAQPRRLSRRNGLLSAVLITLLLFVLGGFSLFPFLWMISTSLKDVTGISAIPPEFIPTSPTVTNYRRLIADTDFLRWLINSTVVSGAVLFFSLQFNSMAGYAFAKTNFPGRNALFILILSSLMVPGFVLVLPRFIMVARLRLVNTYFALIFPGIAGPFGIFLMKQYISTIPDDLIAAAKIDGCSEFRIFYMVVLPLVTPALAALAVFLFLFSWNNFFWPLIATTTRKMRTLPVGLAMLHESPYGENFWGLLMSGSFLAFLPGLAIFLALQRYFVQGIALSGLKG